MRWAGGPPLYRYRFIFTTESNHETFFTFAEGFESQQTAEDTPGSTIGVGGKLFVSGAVERTTRSYDVDIRHFKQRGGTIPATAAMVAEDLANFTGTLAVATLQHRLLAIPRAHIDSGLSSPTMDHLVKRTMQGIRRTLGTQQRRVTALVKDDLLELMFHLDQQMR
ncbi:hypothetical protein [Duganella sp. BuS-21]|uniref:hypothetical protein n=1 Tax=Duganella sp. BuS-21 TaxID=2943848 RepID=UPI0035A6F6CF